MISVWFTKEETTAVLALLECGLKAAGDPAVDIYMLARGRLKQGLAIAEQTANLAPPAPAATDAEAPTP
jgi:hypothetical protein